MLFYCMPRLPGASSEAFTNTEERLNGTVDLFSDGENVHQASQALLDDDCPALRE
jgi:hypothetical protein